MWKCPFSYQKPKITPQLVAFLQQKPKAIQFLTKRQIHTLDGDRNKVYFLLVISFAHLWYTDQVSVDKIISWHQVSLLSFLEIVCVCGNRQTTTTKKTKWNHSHYVSTSIKPNYFCTFIQSLSDTGGLRPLVPPCLKMPSWMPPVVEETSWSALLSHPWGNSALILTRAWTSFNRNASPFCALMSHHTRFYFISFFLPPHPSDGLNKSATFKQS